MSGGSMDYFSYEMEKYCSELKDKELVELAKDMAKLFHDKEWADSGDTSEGDWNKSVIEFKKKWFEAPREERLLRYIDEAVGELKFTLGLGSMCKDCKNFEDEDKGDYGRCCYHQMYLIHGYEKACERFEK